MITGINFIKESQADQCDHKLYELSELMEKKVKGVVHVLWKDEWGELEPKNTQRISMEITSKAPKVPIKNPEQKTWDVNKIPLDKRPYMRKLYEEKEWQKLKRRIEDYGVAKICGSCGIEKTIKPWMEMWIKQGVL